MDRFSLIPLEWQSLPYDLLRLTIAYLLALPIGWNREKEAKSAGLRTFPIVSVAACGFALIGTAIPNPSGDSYSRILQGLITGIGFIGGGAILRDKEGVRGTATAASIWNIGIVGAAVGLGLVHIAVILTAINWITLKLLTPLKKELESELKSPPED